MILVYGIIIQSSYLVNHFQLIGLSCVNEFFGSCFNWCVLNLCELLNGVFYRPAVPHGLDDGVHKAIKLIRLIAQ